MQPNVTNNLATPAYAWQRWSYVRVGVVFFAGDLGAIPFWKMDDSSDLYRDLWIGLALFWIGVFASQFLLLAVYGVFGTDPGYVRLPVTILIGSALGGVIWLHAVQNEGRPHQQSVRELFEYVLLTLGLVMAAQLPLWIVKWYFAWQLIPWGKSAPYHEWPEFSISKVLTTIALILVIFYGCPWAAILLNSAPQDFLPVLYLFLGLTLVVVGIFCALPVLLGIFRPRKLENGLNGLVIYSACWLALIALPMVMAQAGPPPAGEAVFTLLAGLSVGLAGLSLGLLIPLHLARSQGYRLIWGRETEFPQSEGDST